MKFSTREDIDAPIDHVFQAVTDFEAYERQALRRGADVKRLDDGPVKVGSTWDVAFSFRGKERQVKATLAAMDPQGLKVEAVSPNLEGETLVELVPLSPQRTRLAIGIDMRAKTLTARLMLQSLKLAKASLNQRFKKRVADFAEDTEARYKPRA